MTGWEPVGDRRFGRRPGALVVREARRWTGALVGDRAPWIAVDDVRTVVSELVTNALLHTASRAPSGSVGVRVLAAGPVVRVVVVDDGGASTVPRLGGGDGDVERGRGLLVVEALAANWGHTTCGPSRSGITWAEFT